MRAWKCLAGIKRDSTQAAGVVVRVAEYSLENLVTSPAPLVRRKERFVPVKILTTPAGKRVVDMGQNFSGWCNCASTDQQARPFAYAMVKHWIKMAISRWSTWAIKPRFPAQLQTVSYTLRGGGEEVYAPFFTVHGFRYVKVEGFPGTPTQRTLLGHLLSILICRRPVPSPAQNRVSISFSTTFSGARRAIFWRSPLMCPTRERAGWTGDAQIYCSHASFLMQTAEFL